VAGLHDSPAIVQPIGRQLGVQVQLTPIGARMIFGMPMNDLTNRVVDLTDVIGRTGAQLANQVFEAASWQERFDLLDKVLLGRLASVPEPSPTIAWAWRRLCLTRGRLQINTLASEVGLSRQHLFTMCTEEVGLPPKTMARIVRFQHALELLQRGDMGQQSLPANPGITTRRTSIGTSGRSLAALRWTTSPGGCLMGPASRGHENRATFVQDSVDCRRVCSLRGGAAMGVLPRTRPLRGPPCRSLSA
jgi:AraC-like DNA-binding protein